MLAAGASKLFSLFFSQRKLFIWGTTLVKGKLPDRSTEPYPPTTMENRLGTQSSRPFHYIYD